MPGEGERLPRAAQRVLDFLVGRGDAVPVHVIASQVNIGRNTVSKHLRETLSPRGLAEADESGRYPAWRALHTSTVSGGPQNGKHCTPLHTPELCDGDTE